MKEGIKSVLKYSLVLFGGIIIGAVLLESLEVYVRPTYTDILMSQMKAEQEFLASRAARENRAFEAAFHRWAAVNAEAEAGFRVFRPESGELNQKSYLLPFQLFVLKMIASPPEVKKGGRILEGINRGRLAVSFEALGQMEEAQRQWELAQQLTKRPTLEATKEVVFKIMGQESSELHRKAEDAVLGSQPK